MLRKVNNNGSDKMFTLLILLIMFRSINLNFGSVHPII